MKVERHTSRKSYEDFWVVRLNDEEIEAIEELIKELDFKDAERFNSILLERFPFAEHTKYDKENEKSVLIRRSSIIPLIFDYISALIYIEKQREVIESYKYRLKEIQEEREREKSHK